MAIQFFMIWLSFDLLWGDFISATRARITKIFPIEWEILHHVGYYCRAQFIYFFLNQIYIFFFFFKMKLYWVAQKKRGGTTQICKSTNVCRPVMVDVEQLEVLCWRPTDGAIVCICLDTRALSSERELNERTNERTAQTSCLIVSFEFKRKREEEDKKKRIIWKSFSTCHSPHAGVMVQGSLVWKCPPMQKVHSNVQRFPVANTTHTLLIIWRLLWSLPNCLLILPRRSFLSIIFDWTSYGNVSFSISSRKNQSEIFDFCLFFRLKSSSLLFRSDVCLLMTQSVCVCAWII